VSQADTKSAGLCASCGHARRVTTPRSEFLLCEKSRTDSSYARYPRLPVLSCPGYEPTGSPDDEGAGPASDPREAN
jgi:hypothetical protein